MVSFVEYIELIKNKWKTIFLIVLSCILIGTIYSKFFIKQHYEAKAKIFIGKQKFKNTAETYNNEEVVLYQRLITTYSEVVKSRQLINKSINESKINYLKGISHTEAIKYENVIGGFSVTPITNTQIIELKHASYNPQLSYDLLYSITENLISYSKELYPTVNIKVLEQVNITHGNLANKKLMVIGVSLILGLISGIGLVIANMYFDNTFKSKEALEDEINISVLGVIPDVEI